MAKFENGAAYFGGLVLPLADAGLPLTDWGLTHSDIAYDVVPVWNGCFFRLDDYIDRFEASMASARMHVGMDRAQVEHALHQMVCTSGLRDAYVAMVAARGRNPVQGSRDPRDCQNHFYAWCVPYVHIVAPDDAAKGTSVWIAKSVRRIPKDSVDPRVKNYHWGDFTSGLFEAKDNGFETTLLLDHTGNVTEGPGFNVFAVFGDAVITPQDGVLHGITRQTVLEMCANEGLRAETRILPLDELWAADEVFLSSSGGGVIPVAQIDDHRFSNNSAGPVALNLRNSYFEWMQKDRLRTPVRG